MRRHPRHGRTELHDVVFDMKMLLQLQEEFMRLQREKGEADGLVQILQTRLRDAEDDNFDLRANMVTVEAEIQFASKQKEKELQHKMAALESKLSFMQDQLQNAERMKVRAWKEVEELQQRQVLEQKRLDAEKRLLATKKRKQESVLLAASQSLMQHSRMAMTSSVPSTPRSTAPTTSAVVQTEPPSHRQRCAEENRELLAKIMGMASRDLLLLLNGTTAVVNDSDAAAVDSSASTAPVNSSAAPAGVAFSQSVLSQIAGQAQAQVQATLRKFEREVNLTQVAGASQRAQDLYDTLAKMVAGGASAIALAPVFVKYLASPKDLDEHVLSSVMRVIVCLAHVSDRFRNFLLFASHSAPVHASQAGPQSQPTVLHPRIGLCGLQFASLDQFLALQRQPTGTGDAGGNLCVSVNDETELKQVRAKLLSAISRVIKNHLNTPVLVDSGLTLLRVWVGLAVQALNQSTSPTDFKPLLSGNLIQDILLAPKGLARDKCKALGLLRETLRFPDVFGELENSAKKSLLLNRCARMLSQRDSVTSPDTTSLQRSVIALFMNIVTSFPSAGVRFVLENSRGHPSESDGDRSVIYHLAQLLDRETVEVRVNNAGGVSYAEKSLLADRDRVELIREAFTLISLLVRYVDLPTELDGADHEHAFLGVLYLLSTGKFDRPQNTSVSKTATAIIAMIYARVGLSSYGKALLAFATMVIGSPVLYIVGMALFIVWLVQSINSGEGPSTEPNPVDGSMLAGFIICEALVVLLLLAFWCSILHARGQIRNRLHIPGSCVEDLITVTVCPVCTIAQMATQVQSYQPGSCSFGSRSVLPPRNAIDHTTAMTRHCRWVGLLLATCSAVWLQATQAQQAEGDKTCFEFPIVVVSPVGERLPTQTCNQQRYPAPDCMTKEVSAILEVVDHGEEGRLNCLNDTRTAMHGSRVHYRGQSSLRFGKHQLSVKLDEDEEFLQFPADRSFVLNGPFIDGSLMRNHLAQWLYRSTGRYSPRTRHLVVFIRDALDPSDDTPQYKGIYLALERISYGPNRVGLAPLDNTCRRDQLSGGWAWQTNPLKYGVNSPNMVMDQYSAMFGTGERPLLMAPKASQLTQTMRDYFVDPATGPLPLTYRYLYDNMTQPDQMEEHLDIGSFVDYFLHTEMSLNSDAYRRSAYYFKDRDEPINAGPVWDFNLAYGLGANGAAWLYFPHTFWRRLFCNYKFVGLVAQRWRALRADVWSDASVLAFIEDAAAPIRRQLAKCHDWITPSLQCAHLSGVVHGSFDDNVNQLKQAVTARTKWMDENIATFYRELDNAYCDPAGPLPKYNCAADGDDDGCLTDPDKYINALEFPPIRKPFNGEQCQADPSTAATLEQPSIDPCWMSSGFYIQASYLTPFCNGYGFCDPGPGAKCRCNAGHKPPTCARSDSPPMSMFIEEAAVIVKGNDGSSMGAISMMMIAAVAAVAIVTYRRRQRRAGYQQI
ncbi:TPA: LOW QUALITY PROTEIN: hypothetical protein N0F65_003549 [Lagenidium giganteum]|uniref:Uncharacterized protein n=1 Tax=Lagenidium giganteum TaxID=4803 RepID=A0AAV2Z323_9STRA|nr:TPA: LOW QUALITY PROTEIN: hypothetical protein N0F65_003549 [Lagenidium giganteum]